MLQIPPTVSFGAGARGSNHVFSALYWILSIFQSHVANISHTKN